jgi:hypothetical protein
MIDNVIPFETHLRTKKRLSAFRTAEAADADFQAHAFLQLCEAGFLPRDQLAYVATYLPLTALIVLKELLKER